MSWPPNRTWIVRTRYEETRCYVITAPYQEAALQEWMRMKLNHTTPDDVEHTEEVLVEVELSED